MGWYGCHKAKGQSYLEFFKGEIEADGDTKIRRIVDAGVKNFVFYAIIADIDKETGTTEHWTAIYKFQISRDYYNVTYKPMSEGVHPYGCYDVPEKIWKLIEKAVPVPTDTTYGGDWRRIVRERKARPRLRKGVRFELVEPLRFKNGEVLSQFEYVERGRLRAILPTGGLGYNTYRISNLSEREYRVLGV